MRRSADWWKRIKRWFRKPEPEASDDPYALVGAPRKPRSPLRGSPWRAQPGGVDDWIPAGRNDPNTIEACFSQVSRQPIRTLRDVASPLRF